MADVNINVGSDGGTISDSNVEIGNVAGRDNAPEPHDTRHLIAEVEQLRQRVKELEQLVFGDARLGIQSVRQEIKGLRFWIMASTAITVIWVIYEVALRT